MFGINYSQFDVSRFELISNRYKKMMRNCRCNQG